MPRSNTVKLPIGCPSTMPGRSPTGVARRQRLRAGQPPQRRARLLRRRGGPPRLLPRGRARAEAGDRRRPRPYLRPHRATPRPGRAGPQRCAAPAGAARACRPHRPLGSAARARPAARRGRRAAEGPRAGDQPVAADPRAGADAPLAVCDAAPSPPTWCRPISSIPSASARPTRSTTIPAHRWFYVPRDAARRGLLLKCSERRRCAARASRRTAHSSTRRRRPTPRRARASRCGRWCFIAEPWLSPFLCSPHVPLPR